VCSASTGGGRRRSTLDATEGRTSHDGDRALDASWIEIGGTERAVRGDVRACRVASTSWLGVS